MLCGLHNRHVQCTTLRVDPARRSIASFHKYKNAFRCGFVLDAAGFFRILIGTKSFLCFRSISCNFESYAAHCTPPLFAVCCKKQQQQKTPRAQQCLLSLLMPCTHGKLEVKHHRTTPKTEIHIYHGRESRSCAREKIDH